MVFYLNDGGNNDGASVGFMLIELLLVIGIVGLFISLAVYNFNRDKYGRVELERAAQIMANDIREAQTRATAGSVIGGKTYCGFGIHKVNTLNNKQYIIYGGLKVVGAPSFCYLELSKQYNTDCGTRCGSSDHDDVIGLTRNLFGNKVEFKTDFGDIFYESPWPTAYLQNSYGVPSDPDSDGPAYYNANNYNSIVIRIKNTSTCTDSTCITLCVYRSGRIDIMSSGSCVAGSGGYREP